MWVLGLERLIRVNPRLADISAYTDIPANVRASMLRT